MNLNTNLKGRLRNTTLPQNSGLLPVFEAVVNSIQSISEARRKPGQITVQVIRDPRPTLFVKTPGGPLLEKIIGFKITDNGIGFTHRNLESFNTLDSDYKADQLCRGVGRLLWLKAFDDATITSAFEDEVGKLRTRSFRFTSEGVSELPEPDATLALSPSTTVELSNFQESFRSKAPKSAQIIARDLLEHCLWYFIRDGDVPRINVIDGDENISLASLYESYMLSSSAMETVTIRNHAFDLTHIRMRPAAERNHTIAFCAASRVVREEKLSTRIPGLGVRINDADGDFQYHCYVSAPFLDEHVRPERIGFDIGDDPNLLAPDEPTMSEIDDLVVQRARVFLEPFLEQVKTAARSRIETFVAEKAPKYRPILKRIDNDALIVDPQISDRDLEIVLYQQLAEIEVSLIAEGHEVLSFNLNENEKEYRERLEQYLSKAEDIKKSDLVNYVFHRRATLEILEKAIGLNATGNYSKENLIHEMIMPMGTTSNESSERSNLWILDERLAFHRFLSSDKQIATTEVVESQDKRKPDLFALSIFDRPVLIGENKGTVEAAITVVELKRPMRADAGRGDENPIDQTLEYLQRIREGKIKYPDGRPVVVGDTIPGFCYVVADMTPAMVRACRQANLTMRHDKLGYFGYNQNYQAYVEVATYDGILKSAKERNRAFFDSLGLPIF